MAPLPPRASLRARSAGLTALAVAVSIGGIDSAFAQANHRPGVGNPGGNPGGFNRPTGGGFNLSAQPRQPTQAGALQQPRVNPGLNLGQQPRMSLGAVQPHAPTSPMQQQRPNPFAGAQPHQGAVQPRVNPALMQQHRVGNNTPRPLANLPTSPRLNTVAPGLNPPRLTNPGRVGGFPPSRGNAPALGQMGSPATNHSVFKPTPTGPHPSPFPQGPKAGVAAPNRGQSVFNPIPQRQGPGLGNSLPGGGPMTRNPLPAGLGTRHPNNSALNTLKGLNSNPAANLNRGPLGPGPRPNTFLPDPGEPLNQGVRRGPGTIPNNRQNGALVNSLNGMNRGPAGPETRQNPRLPGLGNTLNQGALRGPGTAQNPRQNGGLLNHLTGPNRGPTGPGPKQNGALVNGLTGTNRGPFGPGIRQNPGLPGLGGPLGHGTPRGSGAFPNPRQNGALVNGLAGMNQGRLGHGTRPQSLGLPGLGGPLNQGPRRGSVPNPGNHLTSVNGLGRMNPGLARGLGRPDLTRNPGLNGAASFLRSPGYGSVLAYDRPIGAVKATGFGAFGPMKAAGFPGPGYPAAKNAAAYGGGFGLIGDLVLAGALLGGGGGVLGGGSVLGDFILADALASGDITPTDILVADILTGGLWGDGGGSPDPWGPSYPPGFDDPYAYPYPTGTVILPTPVATGPVPYVAPVTDPYAVASTVVPSVLPVSTGVAPYVEPVATASAYPVQTLPVPAQAQTVAVQPVSTQDVPEGTVPVQGVETVAPGPEYVETSQVVPNTVPPQNEKRLLLVNPKDSGGPVRYSLDGNPYNCEPGNVQDVAGPGSWLVEFDRGTGGETARYTLTEGTYTFTVTEKGWELYNTTYTVALDNSANGGDFFFLLDGKEESVPAGATRSLTGKFPMVVSFDRGDGGDPAARTLESGTYRVGLGNDSKALDLIPVEDRSEAPSPSPGTAGGQ